MPAHRYAAPIATRAAVVALAVASLCGWTILVGKDLSWDVLNHHVYLPFSLLSGRFATDLFAAGPQSYQNPLGYLPFYALLSSNFPDWLVGIFLASLHAAAVWPLWRIAGLIWPDGERDRWWRVMGIAMAWIAPSFLLAAGTSSVDPLTNVLVLWALALDLDQRRTCRSSAAAGGLLGLAFAIKPTNAVFVIACAAVILHQAGVSRAAIRGLVAFFAAAGLAALLTLGPWAWWLWSEFRSPFFPLFNQWFGSKYAPTQPIIADRFLLGGPGDLIHRVWAFIRPNGMVHTEARAPDLRPAALALSLLGLAAEAGLARVRGARGRISQPSDHPRHETSLLIFLGVAYLLWMATSGNSRYALPWFMVVGLALVRTMQRLLPRRPARIVLGVLFALQVLNYGFNGTYRFGTPVRWSGGSYVGIEAPRRLRDQPFLHLSLGTPSHAVVAPALHHDGALINVTGIFSIPNDGPLGEKLRQRLNQWQGRIRVLSVGRVPVGDGAEARQFRARSDRVVYRFGLQIDWGDCEPIRLPMRPAGTSAEAEGDLRATPGIPLMSCRAVARTSVDPHYDEDRLHAEQAFHVLESQCPRVFGPPPMATNADLGAWRRFYMNSDARAIVSPTEGVSVSTFSSWKVAFLGSMDDVIAGRGKPACAAWKELDIE